MIKDSITLGETYVIPAEAQDADGVTLVMDGTWECACRVTKNVIGGDIVLDEVAMDIVEGKGRLEIDTGESPWVVGVYVYDVRITDPDGNDFWSTPVQLKLTQGNTPKSS